MSDIREDFQQLLQNYPCSDFQSDEKNYENAIKKTEWILKHVPKKLYRFRPCSEYAIAALENDEIWGTVASKQNDIMEYLPYFDWNKIYEDIESILNNIDNFQSLLNAVKSDILPLIIQKQLIQSDIENLKDNISKNINDDNAAVIMKQLYTILVNQIKQNENEYLKLALNQIFATASMLFISCFSEENDSSYLWGNYADNNTGFCIEYNMKNYLSKCPEKCDSPKKCSKFHSTLQLAPVIYSSRKPDASSVLSNIIIENISKKIGKEPKQYLYQDNNIANNLALYKSDKWVEKEWRLLAWNQTTQYKEYECIHKTIQPTAIYLGPKISEENQNKLIDISKRKNIPCFKAFPDYFSAEYKYVFFDVNELYKNTVNNKEIT